MGEETVKASKLANDQFAQNIKERKALARTLLILTCTWLGIVIAIILMSGWKKHTDFFLSDNVLIALITTTTINVIALFKVVTEYIFPDGDSPGAPAIPKAGPKK